MRQRVELVVRDSLDDSANDLLLAHDAARIAAPVVPKPRVPDRALAVEMLQARLEVNV